MELCFAFLWSGAEELCSGTGEGEQVQGPVGLSGVPSSSSGCSSLSSGSSRGGEGFPNGCRGRKVLEAPGG